MKSRAIQFCVGVSLVLMAPAHAQSDQESASDQDAQQAAPQPRHWRLINGEQYAQMEPGLRQTYVAGLSDAFNLMRTQGAEYEWIVRCSINVQAPQLQAIFENWLKNHQDLWQKSASQLYLTALRENCTARQQQQQQ